MTARPLRQVRWVFGLVVVVLVVTLGRAPDAEAHTAQAEGECVELARNTYEAPETITPPDHPNQHGYTDSLGGDERFSTTYCFQGGAWKKTRDGFPYDAPGTCVGFYYDPDDHEGRPPPDRITPLTEIDQYGSVDSRGEITGSVDAFYCRQGDEWIRRDRWEGAPFTPPPPLAGTPQPNPDYPQGQWDQWAAECVTILPDRSDLPFTTDGSPDPSLGRSVQHRRRESGGEWVPVEDTEDSGIDVARIDASLLKTYCRRDVEPVGNAEGDPWHRVDNYPLSEVLDPDQQGRLQEPDSGECVVLDPLLMEDPPETISPPGHPSDYGTMYPQEDYEQTHDADYEATPYYCYSNGAWYRNDSLLTQCQADAEGQRSRPGAVLPSRCLGTLPTGNYDIGYDEGAWNHFSRKVQGWWTGLFFDLGKTATRVSLWAVEWAYTFDISRYDELGMTVGEDYRRNLVENPAFRLVELVWLILIAYAGFMALRGKLSLAGGEIVMSVLLLGLSTVLMVNRRDYMESTWELMDKGSTDLMIAGQGRDPTTAENQSNLPQTVRDMQRQMHGAFVEQPYDLLNWGAPLSDACEEARNEIVARGPHGADDWPRDRMREAGCVREADFNAEPSSERMLGSLLVMAASAVLAFMLLAVSLTVVVAKFVALLLFALAAFAALAAIAPGGLRRIAWLWLATLFQVVLAVLGMSFLLSVLLLTTKRLLDETVNVDLVERFFVVNLVVLVVLLARRRMLAAGQSSAGRLVDNLTNVRLGGGGAAWQGPGGGAGGVNLLNIDRGLEGARARAGRIAVRGGIAAGFAGGWLASRPFVTGLRRATERRVAHRAYRNNQRIRHYELGLHDSTYRTFYVEQDPARSQKVPTGDPAPTPTPMIRPDAPRALGPGPPAPSRPTPGRPASPTPGGGQPGPGPGGLVIADRHGRVNEPPGAARGGGYWTDNDGRQAGHPPSGPRPGADVPGWKYGGTIAEIRGRRPEPMPPWDLPKGPVERVMDNVFHPFRTAREGRENRRWWNASVQRADAAQRNFQAFVDNWQPGDWPNH